MRVVLDARWIFPEISGIGRYTEALIRHLVPMAPEVAFVLLFDRPDLRERTLAATGIGNAANLETRLVDFGVLSVRNQIRGPGLLQGLGADVYHSPNYLIPLQAFPAGRRGRTACVVTIHDVIPLAFPDHAPRARKRRLFPIYKRLMREVGRRADLLLTVSAASRRDVIRHLHIPQASESAVRVIYNGVDPQYHPPTGATSPHPPTLLFVGRMDPYKNLVAVIEALAILRAGRVPDARLRVVGAPDHRYPDAPDRARRLGLDEAIDWIGYASDDELLRHYQEADVFALPSRYEGFGLPVIEAMACGTPVVCGNAGSLPEIAGDAAIQVDPDHIRGLADAIARILTDPATAAALRDRGLAQAARFSWHTCAQQTLQAYRDACARAGA
jgi:alpha-1,3-rhamnosyl/mannosyltransferase